MRFAHYLQPNTKTELPSQLVFLDTETKPEYPEPGIERHRLWFGYAKYVRIRKRGEREWIHKEWHYFETPASFWNWLDSKVRKGSKCYIFVHNWNFDGSVLYTASQLRELGYETLSYVNEKPPFILRVRKGKKYLALIDTLNYFTTSLENLGESIGIAKKEFPGYDADLETWQSYCRRDVDVLERAVLLFRDFISREDLGNFRPTLASQAFNAFRHRFYSGGLLIHDTEDVLELEREAYYGGRVECFFVGRVREELYYLDVNSLYPYVMAENEYPTRLVGERKNVTVEDLREYLKDRAVVARVEVDTTEPVYPTRRRKKLVFPTGRFVTSLCTPELLYALEHGHIRRVFYAAIYLKAPLFNEYVTALYQARQRYTKEDNPAFAYMCKIMLNSLYGKFGQRGVTWEDVREALLSDPPDWLEQDEPGDPVRHFRVRAGVVQEKVKQGESRESFPAIAAHVTAYGRMLLWSLIHEAGKENVYYVDTDSITTNRDGFDSLSHHVDASRLGALKLEGEATEAAFFGAKDYVFGAEERHKGIRRNAEQLNRNTWRQQQFRSWDWHMSQGEEGYIDIKTITKTLHRNYDKGLITETGRVEPWTLTTE